MAAPSILSITFAVFNQSDKTVSRALNTLGNPFRLENWDPGVKTGFEILDE
jgi:hypothetical protein